MTSVDIAYPAAAILGECPVWSPDDNMLYWVDIEGRVIHRFDPATGTDESRQTHARPGSLVRTFDPGRLLVGMETELVWFDWATGTSQTWQTVEPAGTGNRLNDGRADPAGRYWVGSMYEDVSAGRFDGQLYRIDTDGSIHTMRSDVGVANGLAFDPDRSRMYFADTLHDTVWRYDYDYETGDVRNATPFLDFSELPGHPDGACVDSEGCYWVAAVWAWAVMRFTPEGRLDRTIKLPVEAPTMPAFGGEDLSTLYVTSISTGGSRLPSPEQEHPGALVAIDAGVTGRVDPPFGAPV